MKKQSSSHTDFVQDASYATHFDTYRGLLAKLLKHDPQMFALKKHAIIVDVGCGYGDVLKILRTRGYTNLFGVEPDTQCRKSCVKDKLAVTNGTLTKTNLPDVFADVIIVNQVFHHIDNFAGAVTELKRILKPKGLLCFLEPSPTILRTFMDIVTFHTPLPKWLPFVKTRYMVMKLEMDTGMYPHFLKNQKEFHTAITRHFSKIWLHTGWFFQFGKYTKK